MSAICLISTVVCWPASCGKVPSERPAPEGRWQALQDSFIEAPQGIRFHLLAYPEASPENLSVRVTDVRRRQTSAVSELLVSLRLTLEADDAVRRLPRRSVPVQFEIDGARSEITLEMSGPELELKDHRIPLDQSRQRGWGRVSIPADVNPADNDFYFVFDQPAQRHAVILAEDPAAARPLELAASISPDPAVQCAAETISPAQLPVADWEKAALVLWQAPLPAGEQAGRVQAFVDRGGVIVFFPPRTPTRDSFAGLQWQEWSEPRDGLGVASWRWDQDILAHTESGSALPVGQLVVRRQCGVSGEHTALATLDGGISLLGRVTTQRGGIYFCGTTPAPGDSSLAANGVVLYVLVQRALAAGAAMLGSTRMLVAGEPGALSVGPTSSWKQVTGKEALSTDFAFHAGVYDTGERLLAVNPAAAEEHAAVLPDHRVTSLFRGLDFARVDDKAGSLAALIDEIWRPFLAAMIAALIIEAILCMPRISSKAGVPAGAAA